MNSNLESARNLRSRVLMLENRKCLMISMSMVKVPLMGKRALLRAMPSWGLLVWARRDNSCQQHKVEEWSGMMQQQWNL
eukprot:00768_1